MTAWTTISNALVAVGAKPFATTMQALRDNPLAIAECDFSAPVNKAAWHPYNMVNANDGATGIFFDFGVFGSLTTPTMEANYDYAFRGVNLSHNNGTNTTLNINGVSITGATFGSGTLLNFYFELINPVEAGFPKPVSNFVWNLATNTYALPPAFFTGTGSLTSFTFAWGAGATDAGQLSMYRRRNYMA